MAEDEILNGEPEAYFEPDDEPEGWPNLLRVHQMWNDPPEHGDYIIILHHSGGAWTTEFNKALYQPSVGYYWIAFPSDLPPE